jgi:outer membrane protein
MNKTILALILSSLPFPALADTAPQNLMAIYQQAQTSDPAWASAQSAHLAAQELVIQGKALTLPTASLRANANHTQTDLERAGGTNPFSANGFDKYETYGYRLDVSHPLYRKQNSIQYEQSKTQVAQAEEQLNTAHQDLMLRVTQTYFDVLIAQDKIDLINAQKAAISQQLEQAKANFEVGTATITDVHEAQARFDLTIAQEIAAINDMEAKKRAIQSLTGQFPERLAAAGSNLQVAIPEPRDMEKWVEVAEQNNLALKIQLQTLELAGKEVERTKAGHLPTLDIVGSYSDNRANGGTSEERAGYNKYLKTGVIGLQLEIPLYQGGAITSKEREAAANKQKALDDVESVRRQAALETRQAYLNVSSLVAQVKAYEQALVSSQSQLDSTSLGYEVGVRTSVDVLNAQQQLYSAKRDLLQARYNYLVSVVQLKAAAGVLSENDLNEVNRMLEGS